MLRDLYLVHRSVSFSDTELTSHNPNMAAGDGSALNTPAKEKPKLSVQLNRYFSRYQDLFVNPRLRNSTISSCTVALGQQLCGGEYHPLSP